MNTEALPLALSLEVANNLEAPTIVAALVAFLAPPRWILDAQKSAGLSKGTDEMDNPYPTQTLWH